VTAKVATLPGAVIVGPTPRQNVIEEIERLLEDAKAGNIQTFGLFYVDAEGHIQPILTTSGLPHAHHCVAGAHYLLRMCERNAGCE
jgi:hypothetical protein